MREIETDGFITREIDIRSTEGNDKHPLERTDQDRAKPMTECNYPNCEECREYINYKGQNYCTVPIVIDKQTWHLTADLIADMEKRIKDLEVDVVTLMIHSPHIPRG